MAATTGSSIALDLTWAELDRVVDLTAGQIRADGPPDVVVGILRGGMVPAVMFAHQLGVRAVRGIGAVHTLAEGPNATKAAQPTVTGSAWVGDLAGRDVLLVDDVAGSGKTMQIVSDMLALMKPARLRRAVVVVNTTNWSAAGVDAFDRIDYVGTACAGWVRFPWEMR